MVSALVFSPLVIPYLVFGIALLVLFTLFDKVLIQLTGSYIDVGLHAVIIGHVVGGASVHDPDDHAAARASERLLRRGGARSGCEPVADVLACDVPAVDARAGSAFLIAFTLSFDEYAIASFLAGTQVTWPVYLFAQLRVPSQLPELVAVSSVILVISIGLVVSAEFGRRRSEGRVGIEL